jgi:TatD DNase family protein
MEKRMKIFDTHTHISLEQFAEDRDDVISRMKDAGVARALVVADSTEAVPFAAKLCEAHNFLYLAVGVHPHNASKYTPEAEKVTLETARHPKFVCVGEIGLDYHYDLSPRDVQKDVFARQIDLAYVLKRPMQLHIREAHGDNIEMLRAAQAAGRLPEGIMHCYTGSWESAKIYLDLGMYISLTGAVTFKNAPKLAEVAQKTPLDRLLVETDCPYMAPVPLRGRRNEPAFIVHTVQKIAELRGMEPEELAAKAYENANRAFNLSSQKTAFRT